MEQILLISSESEPYGRYLERLSAACEASRLSAATRPIEDVVLGAGVPRPAAVIPCTNHPQIGELVRYFAQTGVLIVNPGLARRATSRTVIAERLHIAGVPVPRFWSGMSLRRLLETIPEAAYPVLVKRPFGYKQDPSLVANPAEFRIHADANEAVSGAGPAAFHVEEYVPADSFIKLYVCGDKVAVYRKYADVSRHPELMETSQALRELAARIAGTLSLDVFSVDLIEGISGNTVVEVHTYPIYKFHPDAYGWVAELVAGRLRAREVSAQPA